MKSRGRLLVLIVSVPVLAFAVVGGFIGRAMAQQEGYQYLRIFEDVVTLIVNNYVEEVDIDKVMGGAMHGLADGLDADSAYLDPQQVTVFDSGAALPEGRTGIELTRQYYLRVIAARDGSPAARAGLRPGDYIRAIDGQSTRDMSVYEGARRLAGPPGTKVQLAVLRGTAAEAHEVTLVREVLSPAPVTGELAAAGIGRVRIPAFTDATAAQLRRAVDDLAKQGATRLILDVRGTAFGDLGAGLTAARLFVPSGPLAYRRERDKEKEALSPPAPSAAAISMPVAVLVDNGTSGAAELFAGALDAHDRATLIGERTLGRAAEQKLVRLPDGSALLLTHVFYLTPNDTVINEQGLSPDITVEQPDVDFGELPPPTDATLARAIEHLGQ